MELLFFLSCLSSFQVIIFPAESRIYSSLVIALARECEGSLSRPRRQLFCMNSSHFRSGSIFALTRQPGGNLQAREWEKL